MREQTVVFQIASALLLGAAANGFEFFVQRQNGVGICITNEREWGHRDLLPLPSSSSLRAVEGESRWLDGWERVHNRDVYKGDSLSLTLDYRTIRTDGSDNFKLLSTNLRDQHFFAFASNATFLLATDKDWKGEEGFRVKLGHSNVSAEFCRKLATEKEECEQLHLLEGKTASIAELFQGNRWTMMNVQSSYPYLTVEKLGKEIFKWNISSEMNDFRVPFLFVRSHQSPGIFKLNLDTWAGPIYDFKGVLSRTFDRVPRCLKLRWQSFEAGSYGNYTLSEYLTGLTLQQGELKAEAAKQYEMVTMRLDLDPGKRSGPFHLELRDLTEGLIRVAPCPEDMEIITDAAGCSVFAQESVLHYPLPGALLLPSSLNSSVAVDLSEEQKKRVCNTLGIKAGRTREEVKFCSKWGCAPQHCP